MLAPKRQAAGAISGSCGWRDRVCVSGLRRLADAEHRLQVAPRRPLPLHAEFDRYDRIGRIDREMFVLTGVNERGEW